MAIKGGPVCISVINMKGGVGKTTVAAMLARYATSLPPFSLGNSKIDTLAVDLDPQANLSQALLGGLRYRQFLDSKLPSIVEVFDGYQPPSSTNASSRPLDTNEIIQRVGPNLQVISSRFDFSDSLIDSVKPDPRILARLISTDFQDRDLVIIDCAPTESILTQAAYHASRFVLVPVKPEFFATIGFPLLIDSLDAFRRANRGHQIDVIGVVINDMSDYGASLYGAPERERALTEIFEEADRNDWHAFENILFYSRGFPKIMRGDYDYPGDAPRMFENFATEFIELMWDTVQPEFLD